MKIIAGKYKNKNIKAVSDPKLRPTTAMVREALFNIIMHNEHANLKDGIFMDIFSGTGAIALEALSRGAKQAILIDKDPKIISIARENITNFAVEEDVTIINHDATNLPSGENQVDICFIDPPYNQDYITPTLISLIENNWLKNNALIIIESSKRDQFTIPDEFTILKEKKYGSIKLLFLLYKTS